MHRPRIYFIRNFFRLHILPTCHKILLNKLLSRFYPQVSGSVLVVGTGDICYSSLLNASCHVLSTDISPSVYVDTVADAHQLPFRDSEFDAYIAIEVFEHLHSPHYAIQEAFRVVKPGGILLLSLPFMFHVHGHPFDYQRLTYKGIKNLCRDYQSHIIPFGNRIHVISDIITTGSKIFCFLRVINHFLALAFPSASHDSPSGYVCLIKNKVS